MPRVMKPAVADVDRPDLSQLLKVGDQVSKIIIEAINDENGLQFVDIPLKGSKSCVTNEIAVSKNEAG